MRSAAPRSSRAALLQRDRSYPRVRVPRVLSVPPAASCLSLQVRAIAPRQICARGRMRWDGRWRRRDRITDDVYCSFDSSPPCSVPTPPAFPPLRLPRWARISLCWASTTPRRHSHSSPFMQQNTRSGMRSHTPHSPVVGAMHRWCGGLRRNSWLIRRALSLPAAPSVVLSGRSLMAPPPSSLETRARLSSCSASLWTVQVARRCELRQLTPGCSLCSVLRVASSASLALEHSDNSRSAVDVFARSVAHSDS